MWPLRYGVINFLKSKRHNRLPYVNPPAGKQNKKANLVFKRLSLRYKLKGSTGELYIPGRQSGNLSINLVSSESYQAGSAAKILLKLRPQAGLCELQSFSLELKLALPSYCRMMVNGFQSWSRSEELGSAERIRPLIPPAKPLLGPYGDYNLYDYPAGKGRFYSWSYTYFRFPDDSLLMIGSLNEKSGYTIFDYDFNSEKLMIIKECSGAEAGDGYELLNLYFGFGSLDLLFDEYSGLLVPEGAKASKAGGWCSWYNYYTKISEDIILKNLEHLAESKLPLQFFQIDDGWQRAIGDWLTVNEKFPAGMRYLSKKIKSSGFKAGLWLAPFVCTPGSDVFRKHPDWLLRDHKGRAVKAGYNPGWGGYFYALDFYLPRVQEYLNKVFETLVQHWGFELLKLDFLYAAALIPRNGKSRGQIMCEALDFLDQAAGSAITLGCGVPLGPAFGRFDYCRIGSDVAPYWEDYLKHLSYRERVSTENSLVSTISRRQLDRRFFRNDPDVFLLRDGIKGVNENRLTEFQRATLFLLNYLLGGLFFFSDNYSELTITQKIQLSRAFPLIETAVTGYEHCNHLHQFQVRAGGKGYLIYANLAARPAKIKIPEGLWFSAEYFLTSAGANLVLEPYQSVVFYRVNLEKDKPLCLLGAVGHLLPAAQVQTLTCNNGEAKLLLDSNASSASVIYLALARDHYQYRVNGKIYRAEFNGNIAYLSIPFQGCRRE